MYEALLSMLSNKRNAYQASSTHIYYYYFSNNTVKSICKFVISNTEKLGNVQASALLHYYGLPLPFLPVLFLRGKLELHNVSVYKQ